MRKTKLLIFALFALCSCGGSVSNTTPPSGQVNQVNQVIMVMPSDKLLKKARAITEIESQGAIIYSRNFNKFLLDDNNNKLIISAIQGEFAKQGYPLVDLEQTLKSLSDQQAIDAADNIAKDAKTLLLSTARPDIIIEVDYDVRIDSSTKNFKQMLDYSVVILDAFSNKTIGTLNQFSLSAFEKGSSVESVISKSIKENTSDIKSQIDKHFADIKLNGREITFSVMIDKESSVSLRDEYNTMGDSYADWIRDWIKTRAKNGIATMQRNTEKEAYYVNVRIENNNPDGTQYNAYDFADDFRKEFYKTFEIRIINNTQGTSGAFVVIK